MIHMIDDLNKALRKEARKIGADAVIKIEYKMVTRHIQQIPNPFCQGTAVIYTE